METEFYSPPHRRHKSGYLPHEAGLTQFGVKSAADKRESLRLFSCISPQKRRIHMHYQLYSSEKISEEFFCWSDQILNDAKRQWAIEQLRNKGAELGRIPLKADFDAVTLSRIKAFLGPWPRALEAAGLKTPKPKET